MKFPNVAPGTYPPTNFADYRSTALRGPMHTPTRVTGAALANAVPPFRPTILIPKDADLTVHGKGAPLGERIVVTGRVTDEDGTPVRDSLVEIWQCNACGRYEHKVDQHDAPNDPNFPGFGKAFTDANGWYKFITVKPGAYPWGNHPNAWRPAHIHFSLFGNIYAQRVITQMYFPNDPLFNFDPIFNSVPDEKARLRLVSEFKLEHTVDSWALGYEFNIVLRGRDATPLGH